MTLTFSPEAQKVLSNYYKENALKRLNGKEPWMDEVRDKLFIYVEKWAALAHLLHGDRVEFFSNHPKERMGDRFADGIPCSAVIDAPAVDYAVRCMNTFEQWAGYVMESIGSNDLKQVSLADAIRTLHKMHPIINKKQFAESCGMTREQLYKYLPKSDGKTKEQDTSSDKPPDDVTVTV